MNGHHKNVNHQYEISATEYTIHMYKDILDITNLWFCGNFPLIRVPVKWAFMYYKGHKLNIEYSDHEKMIQFDATD